MITTKTQKTLIAIFTLLTICLLAFLSLEIIYNKKIYLHTRIAGVSYAGLTSSEAEKLLQEKINNFQNIPLDFFYEDGIYHYDLKKLDIQYDVQSTISEAFTNINSFKKIRNIFIGNSVPLKYEISNEKINEIAIELEDDLNIQNAQNATLAFGGNKLVETKEKEGITLDQEKLISSLKKQIDNLSNITTTIETIKDYPDITQKDLAKPKDDAIGLLQIPNINLIYKEQIFNISPTEIQEWIEFSTSTSSKPTITVTLNNKKIEDFLMPLVPQINQEPINARLKIENNKISVFSLSHSGIKLLIEESIEQIKKGILSKQTKINLVTQEINPQVTIENIDNLGITSLLAVGKSDFTGSSASRIKNLTVGSEKINGILIESGKEFSFNETIGEINAATGFVPGQVIKEGKIITEYGGGICQVSTTLFRTALNAGLPITERYNHAFAVHFYEPQGTDSTVYAPHPDLRFTNDTPGYILIQTHVVGNELVFEFYGTNDGRTVTLDGPHIYSQQPSGAMKTVLHQNIYKDDILIRKDSIYSNYKSASLFTTETSAPVPTPEPANSN